MRLYTDVSMQSRKLKKKNCNHGDVAAMTAVDASVHVIWGLYVDVAMRGSRHICMLASHLQWM